MRIPSSSDRTINALCADRLWLSMFQSVAVPTSVPPFNSTTENGTCPC